MASFCSLARENDSLSYLQTEITTDFYLYSMRIARELMVSLLHVPFSEDNVIFAVVMKLRKPL